jgi:hypothetical protein
LVEVEGREQKGARVVASVLLGVSDDPINWGVLREPNARRSQVTKCVEGCLVVIRVQLPLQRLHYAIEHVEPVKIGQQLL